MPASPGARGVSRRGRRFLAGACRCRTAGPFGALPPSGLRGRPPSMTGSGLAGRGASAPMCGRPDEGLGRIVVFAPHRVACASLGTTGGPSASRYCRRRRSRTSAPRVDGPPHSRTAGSRRRLILNSRPTCANKASRAPFTFTPSTRATKCVTQTRTRRRARASPNSRPSPRHLQRTT